MGQDFSLLFIGGSVIFAALGVAGLVLFKKGYPVPQRRLIGLVGLITLMGVLAPLFLFLSTSFSQLVTCLDRPPTNGCKVNGQLDQDCIGTPDRDVIVGTIGDDVIVGLEGDDVLIGRAGNDFLCGAGGNDNLVGGDGDDTLSGGADDDHLTGNAGNDVLIGGEGNDTLTAGEDDDALDGGVGSDQLFGNDGDDALDGGEEVDRLDAGAGRDICFNGETNVRCNFNLGMLPPDPREAGKTTIEGIDSDGDGVRDDLQRYIALTYPDSARTRAALRQLYAAMEEFMLHSDDENQSITFGQELSYALDCLSYIHGIGSDTTRNIFGDFRGQVLNTDERTVAYLTANEHLGGQSYRLVSLEERKLRCAFDPDVLED